MRTNCRFLCNEIVHTAASPEGRTVKLNAVTGNSPDKDDRAFNRWTPSGSISLQVDNPDVIPMFKVGARYRVVIELMEEEAEK